MNDFLTVDVVAQKLSLDVATVRRYIREGKLSAKKVGKAYLISQQTLDRFLGITPPKHDHKPKTPPHVNSMIMETILEMAKDISTIEEIEGIITELDPDLLPLYTNLVSQQYPFDDPVEFIQALGTWEREQILKDKQTLLKELVNQKAVVFLPLPPHLYDSLYAAVPPKHLFLTEPVAQHHLEKAPYERLTMDNFSQFTAELGDLPIVVVDGQKIQGKLYLRTHVVSVLEYMVKNNLNKIYLHKIPHIPPHQPFTFFDYKKYGIEIINL